MFSLVHVYTHKVSILRMRQHWKWSVSTWRRKHRALHTCSLSIAINIGTRRWIIKCDVENTPREYPGSVHGQMQITGHLSVDFNSLTCNYSYIFTNRTGQLRCVLLGTHEGSSVQSTTKPCSDKACRNKVEPCFARFEPCFCKVFKPCNFIIKLVIILFRWYLWLNSTE